MSKAKARKFLGIPKHTTLIILQYYIAKQGTSSNSKGLGRIRWSNKLGFVGSEPDASYYKAIKGAIPKLVAKRFKITGWLDDPTYNMYLSAADIAIQLRTIDTGETSAAAMDCFAYGIPTIVNNMGSFQDLPEDCCIKINDATQVDAIQEAIGKLLSNEPLRKDLSRRSNQLIKSKHSPKQCALNYKEILDELWLNGSGNRNVAAQRIARILNLHPT